MTSNIVLPRLAGLLLAASAAAAASQRTFLESCDDFASNFAGVFRVCRSVAGTSDFLDSGLCTDDDLVTSAVRLATLERASFLELLRVRVALLVAAAASSGGDE